MKESIMSNQKKYTSGQGLTEYALLLVFVALVLVGTVALFGQTIDETYQYLISLL
jgi:Flp pilus assembly pilin Flp